MIQSAEINPVQIEAFVSPEICHKDPSVPDAIIVISVKHNDTTSESGKKNIDVQEISINSLLDSFERKYLTEQNTFEQINSSYDVLTLMRNRIEEKMYIVEDIYNNIYSSEIEEIQAQENEHIYIKQEDESRYIVKTYEKNNSTYIPIPDYISAQLDLKTGDKIYFKPHTDGSIVVTKNKD